mmetsp:Transcript_454/g.1672  ORF Transcript_454/g.1672 Transcript_454/m.1672 type:complete len:230 (+) Transcript_454:490-1179(+)
MRGKPCFQFFSDASSFREATAAVGIRSFTPRHIALGRFFIRLPPHPDVVLLPRLLVRLSAQSHCFVILLLMRLPPQAMLLAELASFFGVDDATESGARFERNRPRVQVRRLLRGQAARENPSTALGPHILRVTLFCITWGRQSKAEAVLLSGCRRPSHRGPHRRLDRPLVRREGVRAPFESRGSFKIAFVPSRSAGCAGRVRRMRCLLGSIQLRLAARARPGEGVSGIG